MSKPNLENLLIKINNNPYLDKKVQIVIEKNNNSYSVIRNTKKTTISLREGLTSPEIVYFLNNMLKDLNLYPKLPKFNK